MYYHISLDVGFFNLVLPENGRDDVAVFDKLAKFGCWGSDTVGPTCSHVFGVVANLVF